MIENERRGTNNEDTKSVGKSGEAGSRGMGEERITLPLATSWLHVQNRYLCTMDIALVEICAEYFTDTISSWINRICYV